MPKKRGKKRHFFFKNNINDKLRILREKKGCWVNYHFECLGWKVASEKQRCRVAFHLTGGFNSQSRWRTWIESGIKTSKSNLVQQSWHNLVMICVFSSVMEHHLTKQTPQSISCLCFLADGTFKTRTKNPWTERFVRLLSLLLVAGVHISGYYTVKINICSSARHLRSQNIYSENKKHHLSFSHKLRLFIMRQYIPQQHCLLHSAHIHRPIIFCAGAQLGSKSTHISNNNSLLLHSLLLSIVGKLFPPD